eukprot:183438_1
MAKENTSEKRLTTPIHNEMRGFIASQSIFSHDSSLLFLYSGHTIYIHSVETGECICSLKGHQSEIVSLIMNPSNHLQLVSMDKHGTIKLWDYLRCTCIDSIDVSSITQLNKGSIYSSLAGCKPVTTSTKSMDKHLYVYCIVNQQHIIAINLNTKHIHPIISNVAKRLDVRGEKESFENLCMSDDGSYLSAIMQREIIILQLGDLKHQLRVVSYKTRGWKLSNALAFHPSNELIAFGDHRGAIHLWHDFVSLFMNASNWNLSLLENKHKIDTKAWQSVDEWLSWKTEKKGGSTREQKYLIRRIHWHSHMVSSIAFTTDGAYMLSGGEESVLVLTQLESSRQQFLPRLGGAITHVSVSADEVKFAVCLKSNTIRIVDSINNRIMKSIEGIGICHRMKPIITQYHHAFSSNPRNRKCFALPSLPGTVQFYDFDKDKSRGTLKLVQYPLISRMQQKYPDRYVAEFMQFNGDGTRLITVIKRTTHSILGLHEDIDLQMDTENAVHLVTLQIWHYNVSKNEFVLNTRIDAPHHAHPIRGIVFHPNKKRFVSFAHNDHTFKIWHEAHATTHLKPRQKEMEARHVTWKSLMSGYYDRDAVTAAQFSNDGTVLFVAAGNMITLWNASNLMLLKKIDCAWQVTRMNTFHRLPYLLTVNEDHSVCIVDLVQFKKHWSVNVNRILDVIIIPFKHKLNCKASQSLFLLACEVDEGTKRLMLCDMQNKKVVHEWVLPQHCDIKHNSMIVQPHTANRHVLKRIVTNQSICDKDIDVVFVTNKGPVRIPCLYTQMATANSILCENDDDDAVTQYLDKITANNSIFERIFGSKGLESKPVDKEELERQKESTRQRLDKLTKSDDGDVVEDMFSGAAHTLPPINDIFEQYMSYFVQNTSKRVTEVEEKARVGNSNVIVDPIKKDNEIEATNKDNEMQIDDDEEDEEDEEDFDTDDLDFEHLKSIVMTPINMNALDGKKKSKKKSKSNNGKLMLSSFWNLRKQLNENGKNGKSLKMNGSLLL